ncbi:cytochrome P450 [Tricladium varicosporioides]|nr:cytochrome P450 [Hymenoscyphus varicosporioides]
MVFSILLGFAILLLLSYIYILHPAFLSPLSAVPNAHFTSGFSNVWMLWQRYRQQANRAIHETHERLGPVVRLGPNELSVNSADGLKVIYNHNFDKDVFYTRFENYGIPNMFSTIQKEAHTRRRRLLGSVYSKSALHSSPEIQDLARAIIIQRLLPIIETAAKNKTPLNMLDYSSAVFSDFISAFMFGLQNGSNYVQNTKSRERWVANKKIINAGTGFWASEFPFVYSLLLQLGICLDNPQIYSAIEEANDQCLEMVQKAEQSFRVASKMPLAGGNDVKWTKPVVYTQIINQLRFPAEKMLIDECPESRNRHIIASETMDHLIAATETSVENLPSHRSIDSLPLLDAVVFETLRLHCPVPGSQPRVTPATNSHSMTTILGYSNIPPGVRVSSQAYSLHRNSKVFPDPETWKPERWYQASQEERSEMMSWFWAFGSGSNMCPGNYFAFLELKFVVAAIYSNYTTRIVDDAGIEQMDGYAVGPKGDKLIVQFEHA